MSFSQSEDEKKIELPLPALDDPEGEAVPDTAPMVVDAHVHLFPDELFSAIWRWFEQFAWPIRYPLTSPEIIEFLFARGVRHVIGLHYAHRPGMARDLNSYMAELVKNREHVTGTATVFPGEDGARSILEDAFGFGLRGVKLHAHVQYFDMDSDAMHVIYEVCSDYSQPLVMHVGREPKNPTYPYNRDPYLICGADKLERVVALYPDLRIGVPHLGADEFLDYKKLIAKYDNLWLDIAMATADYLPGQAPPSLHELRAERVMYGSDFPHIPYAWDRELKKLCHSGLPKRSLELILGKNALEFFGMEIS